VESLELDDDGRQRVRGRYVSVERFLEAKDGSVEWRMATSSTPDGLIPQWLVEKTLPNSIANVSANLILSVCGLLRLLRMYRTFSVGLKPNSDNNR
jgi:hypothetical protein